MKTLGEALDTRCNSINAIRVAFAGSVLLVHAVTLGGYADEMPKLIFKDTLGTYALAGFFVMSGYLITASRLNSHSFGDFLWRRVLRIYPAWIASFALVAFVLGPLSRVMQGRSLSGYDWGSALSFVYKNLLFVLKQFDINGTIPEGSIPVDRIWNFSAWTLFFEFALWISVGVLVLVVPRKLVNSGIVFAFLCCLAIKVYDKFDLDLSSISNTATGGRANGEVDGGIFTLLEPAARLGGFFYAGAVLYIYRDKIKLSRAAVAACLAVCVGLATIGWFHTLAPLFWAYALMYFATSRRFGRFNYPNDLSYGVYIYAFPLTQIWAIVNVDHPMPYVLFAALCAITTVPVAWLSWHGLEKPAMKLKRLTAGKQKPVIGIGAP